MAKSKLLSSLRRPRHDNWQCKPGAHVILTEHLVLQTVAPEDLSRLLALVDDEVRRWQGWTGLTDDELLERFDAATDPRVAHYGFVIIERATGRLIGERTYQRLADTSNVLCGSWLGEGARGRGLGTEELIAFTEFVHQHVGDVALVGETATDNVAAQRQFEKAGFERHDDADETELPNGQKVETIRYAHLDTDAHRTCRYGPDADGVWWL